MKQKSASVSKMTSANQESASVSKMTSANQESDSQKEKENSVLIDLGKFLGKLKSVKSNECKNSQTQSETELLNRFDAIQKLGKSIECFLNLIKNPLVRDIDRVINILKEHKEYQLFPKNDFKTNKIVELAGYKGNIQVLKGLIYQIELSLKRALLILADPQNETYKNELSQGFLSDDEIKTLFEHLNFPQLKDGVEQIIKQLK